MSTTGSFISRDDCSNPNVGGLNPMYQSLQTSTVVEQSEYDEIKGSRSVLLTPSSHKTTVTSNAIYASCGGGDTLKHPTFNSSEPPCEFSALPDSNFDDRESCCKCSADATLCIFSFLIILLSAAAIVLVLLLSFSVVKPSGYAKPTTAPITGSPSTPTTSSYECNCSAQPLPENLSLSLQDLEKRLLNISQELQQLKINENTSVIDTRQQLHNLLSQIKDINNSIEEIRPLSNQPRPPHLTGINLPSSISINIIDKCTITRANPCTAPVPPVNEIINICLGSTVPIINDEGIIVDFICQTSPNPNSINITMETSTSIDRRLRSGETLSNPDDIVELFKKSSFRCYCFNFGTVQARCEYMVTRCPFVYGTLNATIQT